MNESICTHHDGWADGEINIINHRWSFPDSTSSLSEISKWSKPSHHPTRLWTLLPPLTVSLHHVSCSYRVSVYQGVCERLLWVIHAVFRSASCYRFNTPAHTHVLGSNRCVCVCDKGNLVHLRIKKRSDHLFIRSWSFSLSLKLRSSGKRSGVAAPGATQKCVHLHLTYEMKMFPINLTLSHTHSHLNSHQNSHHGANMLHLPEHYFVIF